MESSQLQNYHVVFSDGEYVGKIETLSSQAPAGHILVKVAYSTCDPYDGICSELFKQEGQRLGGEASGVIISVGEGVDAGLLNKKISFHAGSWAQYRVLEVASNHFIILNDDQDLAKAAAAYINPVTAIGQLEIIKEKGAKYYVADAAASSLNKMLIKLARDNGGHEPICIVRKEEQATLLKEQFGVEHVLL
jgi:NADPH2:quinone reductase